MRKSVVTARIYRGDSERVVGQKSELREKEENIFLFFHSLARSLACDRA
jgi:hypothetical protein